MGNGAVGSLPLANSVQHFSSMFSRATPYTLLFVVFSHLNSPTRFINSKVTGFTLYILAKYIGPLEKTQGKSRIITQ